MRHLHRLKQPEMKQLSKLKLELSNKQNQRKCRLPPAQVELSISYEIKSQFPPKCANITCFLSSFRCKLTTSSC